MPDLHKLKRIVTGTVQAFKSKRLVPIVSEKDKDLLKRIRLPLSRAEVEE